MPLTPRILAIATPVVAITVAITASLATFFTTQATATVTSDKVSAERIQLIQQNIDSLHPDASSELKQEILEIAVRAIENQIFVEGGSFMMGDFGMKCKSDR
ncbi:MAG: hypothetical protein OIF55_11895, partial [Amphritea sp.]|nr:hypothetical protein [Amphritea sp.]